MAEGKDMGAWRHTSWLCFVIYSMVAGKKGNLKPDDFNPVFGNTSREATMEISRHKGNFGMLKSIFGAKHGKPAVKPEKAKEPTEDQPTTVEPGNEERPE